MSIWYKTPDLEQANASSENTLMATLGIRLDTFGDNWLRASMPVDQRTHQPYGILHGGASVSLAETVGSFASILTLDPGKHAAVGLSINANHVRAARSGTVHATARPAHLGRSTQVWEIHIVDDNDRLICLSRLTTAIVSAKITKNNQAK